jgi:alpha-methylacyl-CoA racemase
MRQGPLCGIRVLEVAGIGPGPFCGMVLADLGADVVRLEQSGGRGITVVPRDRDLLNRGKRTVAVDLRTPEGLSRALALVERAEVLFEPFRPGVAERLGIGPDVCLERNPRLVYARMTGWGQTGPLSSTAGHDITYIAPTGALHAIGGSDGPPFPPLNLVGDFAGGSMYLAVGILAGLIEARVSGRGQVVDAAICDGTAHLMTPFFNMLDHGVWQDRREANLLDGGAPFYGCYETSDGKYMAVGAIEPQFYDEFVRRLGIEVEAADQMDPRGWPALRERVAAAFAARPRAEWAEIFDRCDACVTPVFSLAEARSHPHLVERGVFVDCDGVVQPAPAPRFSRTPGAISGPPAAPGAHTEEVLADWLE